MKTARYRRAASLSVLCAIGGASAVFVACDTQQETPMTKAAFQTQADVLVIPQAAFGSGAVIFGSDWVSIGDGTRIGSSDARAAVANAGSGTTTIGSDASVGSIWSEGSVDLRDRAVVEGDIHTASNVSQGNNVTIGGTTEIGSIGETLPVNFEIPEFPSSGGNVHVEPGQTRVLEPGEYGELLVKRDATVVLGEGNYVFSKVVLDSGSKLEVTSACEAPRVFSRNEFIFRGEVIEAEGTPDGLGIVIGHLGSAAAHIEQPFEGQVYAPSAELVLSSHTHTGRFFAKRVRVQSGAQLLAPGAEPERPAECVPRLEPPAAPEARDLGPVPRLESADDLPEFLDWFYRIREAEVELAGGAIARVAFDGEVASAVITELDEMREDGELGPSLMLVVLLGAIGADNGIDFLTQLLTEPLPPAPEVGEEYGPDRSPYGLEVAVRRRAIFALASHGSSAARAAITDAATSHDDRLVRAAAIKAIAAHGSDAEIADLKANLLPGDESLLDRVPMSDPDFSNKIQTYLDTYESN